ncbi:tRNA (guanosine(37)-N1)-methyltransferase TrmD [Helicobacter pylori]|uniref:tRNA (guanosine(37)-N1)-methyltransferase TrmD n=1 Tax=Helicobacter pylori TaxID=210 RepID=UPI003085AC1F|nr:tRNA (guanosine(37)-N1)-methyltransferase TrmD [Helicobacter pylori]WQZ91360.1 tRNA (guanosine(37)-N1)-methyltransferase TrmD [Helicobacter pylori]
MKFSVLTLFPQLVWPYFEDSILKRALEKNLFELEVLNLRDFSANKHQKADHTLIGGGAGQILDPEMIENALHSVKNPKHTIFLSAVGKPFKQIDAMRLAQKKHVVLVCGRYEGFDERSIELDADEVFCIGDFILTGGELGALCLIDSIARHIQGVLGNARSLENESFENHYLEAPNFANAVFKSKEINKIPAPLEYSKGNHAKIKQLKLDLSKLRTKFYRLDLFKQHKS